MQNAETPSKLFLINCLSAIQQPLLGHHAAAKYISNLGSMIEMHLSVLVEKEVDAILRRCGLSSKMFYIQQSMSKDNIDVVEPLAEVDGMSPLVISECLRAFFALVSGTEGSLPEFEQMQVPRLRSEACTQVARELAEAYETVYRAILDPKNHYPDPKSVVRHPPDHIRTILGI